MCGEFGEVTVIIGLVINLLAVGTLLLNSHNTLSYSFLRSDGKLFRSVGPCFVVLLKFLVCFRICVFMPCVLRCGFSLIFELGLEKDICLHRITQKSTLGHRNPHLFAQNYTEIHLVRTRET